MPDGIVSAVVQRFDAAAKSKGLSQDEAAKSLAVSPGAYNQVLQGKYNKTGTTRIEEKMERALSRMDRRASKPRKPPICETSVYQRVVHSLRAAHDEGCMSAILGPSQVGKTTAAKHYCVDEPETIYVVLHPNGHNGRMKSARPMMNRIAEALKISLPQNAGNDDWLELIGTKLTGSADLADENILQTIRTIWDLSQIGVVLLGTLDLLANIRRKNSPTLNQVLFRIAYCEIVGGLTEEDAEMLLESFGLDATAIEAAFLGSHGNAGRLAMGIAGAQRLGAEKRGPLDAKLIARAYSKLMPEVAAHGE
jgi:hypothetical protein